jgi:putative FmdB family regulatory protein
MPLYRYTCNACRREFVELVSMHAPNPACCGAESTKLMPRRVVGRVVPDSDGVHAGSGFARSSSAPSFTPASTASLADFTDTDDEAEAVETLLRVEGEVPKSDPPKLANPDHPLNVPLATKFAKDYDRCSADERDACWHDTAEAFTAWQARVKVDSGLDYSTALAQASTEQQAVVSQARAEMQRADGLT